MSNILVVKANNRPDGVSTEMYNVFMENIDQTKNNVTTFDVFAQEMPYIGQDLFNAFAKGTEETDLNEKEATLMAVRQEAMDKVAAADTIVFAFPMWNLSIPAALHTFIDYIFQAGFTFSYNPDGSMNQLLKDKKVILLNARGGIYSGDASVMENSVTYMEKVFGGMFGMDITDEIIIEGHNADPSKTDTIVAAGLKKVADLAQGLA
ncbi:FMN-dependent NADH-azoreductase [Enterococcus asini]|uniref:FMN-dependent NADH-azoreductase n=1 Tax=Enterococcus asini TaxID=57732 RepID=UPI0028910B6C|nr:FMN-dependent NADH-azoreductase [Enterococcus asini]MDT2757460.1 FMN-dependent NADH-azoreductase [Enterococcus asini]